MVGKLAPNPTHFTGRLVKYVPGRCYFRTVSSQDGDEFVTSPPPSIVERVGRNPLSKHQIQPEYGDEQADAGRDG